MRQNHGKRLGLVLAVALAITVSACGSDDKTNSSSTSGPVTPFTLAIVPSQEFVPLYVGITAGIFQKHGIDLKLQAFQDPSPMVAGVTNNSFQGMGLTGRCSRAVQQNIALVSVASFTIRSAYELLATKAVNSLADLAGKTALVGQPTTGPALRLNATLEKAGLTGKVTIQNVASSTTEVAAYRAGQADAIYLDPTILAGLITAVPGSHIIVPVEQTGPPIPGMGLCVSKKYLSDNPGIVRQMIEAMSESYAYALDAQHKDQVVDALMTKSQLPLSKSEAESVYPTLSQTDSPYPIATQAQLEEQVKLDVAGGAKETLADLTATFDFTIAQQVVNDLKLKPPAQLSS